MKVQAFQGCGCSLPTIDFAKAMALLSPGAMGWKPGDQISEVFDLVRLDASGAAAGCCLGGPLQVLIKGWSLGLGRFTIYDAMVISVVVVTVIRVQNQTVIYERPSQVSRPRADYVELFAEFGRNANCC